MKKVSICLHCKCITTKRFCPRCCDSNNQDKNSTSQRNSFALDISEKSQKKVLTSSICPGCGVLAQNKKFAGTHGNKCIPYEEWKKSTSKNPFTSVVVQTLLTNNLILIQDESELFCTEKLSKILLAQIDPDFHQFKDKIGKIAQTLASEIISLKSTNNHSSSIQSVQQQQISSNLLLSRLLSMEEESRRRSDSSSSQTSIGMTPLSTPNSSNFMSVCSSLEESSVLDCSNSFDEPNFFDVWNSKPLKSSIKDLENVSTPYHPYRRPSKDVRDVEPAPSNYKKLLHFLEKQEEEEPKEQAILQQIRFENQNSASPWLITSPTRLDDEMPHLRLYQTMSTSITDVYELVRNSLSHFNLVLQKIKDLPQISKEIQLEEMKFFQPELGNEALERKIDQDRDYFLRSQSNPTQAVHYFGNWLKYFFQQQEYGNAIRCCLEIGCCLAKQYSNNLGTLLSLFSLQTLVQQQQSLNWSSWVEDENLLLFAAEIFLMVHSLQEMSATSKRLSSTSLNNSETFRTLYRFCTKQDSLQHTLERIKKLYRKPTIIDSQRAIRFIAVDDFEMLELGLMFDYLLELSNQQQSCGGWLPHSIKPNLSPLQSPSQTFCSQVNSNSMEPLSPTAPVNINVMGMRFSISSESEEELIREGKQKFVLSFR